MMYRTGTIPKEMEGPERFLTFLGRRHNSHWTHFPQTLKRNKITAFQCYFRDFVGAQKTEDLSKCKKLSMKYFKQTDSF